MLEVLTGTDDFSKYDYCRKLAKSEKKQFKMFNSKDWSEFEAFLPTLYQGTLFSVDYCCYCDFHEGLSKKRINVILELSEILEKSENNHLFIGAEKSIKGLKKSKKVFELPKPWKDDQWKELVKSLGNKMGLVLTEGQIDRLVYDTGPDMWRIHNELSKFVQLADGKTINEDLFNDLFYSYTKEDLQTFIVEFANRDSTAALEKLDEILLENNPMQIIYRLGFFYTLILKIKMLSKKLFYTFNDIRELAARTQTNIPTISDIVGFSFKRSEKKVNIAAQYDMPEIESLINDILVLEIDYKSGEKDFRSQLIGFFENTRR